jgi:hypothetical protein
MTILEAFKLGDHIFGGLLLEMDPRSHREAGGRFRTLAPGRPGGGPR